MNNTPKFLPGQNVVIRALGQGAYCVTARLDLRGWSYLIAYWMDGKRYEEWMFEHELDIIPL